MDGAAAVLEQGLSELLPGGAERNGVDGRAVAGLQTGAHMRLADLLGIGDGVGRQRDHRLGIAGAERAGAGDRRMQLGIRGPRRQGAVDQQGVVAPRGLDGGAQRLFEKGAERAERVLAQA